MWKPMVRSRDSEAVPETRGAPVDRQRQILIRHYNRTGLTAVVPVLHSNYQELCNKNILQNILSY